MSKKLKKTGWWASDTAELTFEDCRVPVENLVGIENAGFISIMMNFAQERLLLASQCVAISELAYRESIRYAKERVAFGKSISGFQVVRHKLADMASRIAAARALTGELAVRHAKGEQVPALAAMASSIGSTEQLVARNRSSQSATRSLGRQDRPNQISSSVTTLTAIGRVTREAQRLTSTRGSRLASSPRTLVSQRITRSRARR